MIRIKGRAAIAFIIGLAVIMLVSGCEVFFLDEYARDNPLDPNNPIKPAVDLEVTGSAAGLVELSWALTSSVPGYHILRKAGQTPPVNTYDGTSVSTFGVTYDTGSGRYFLSDTVPAYSAGSTNPQYYTYRIWTTNGTDHYTDSGWMTVDLGA